jgi:uncharacterized protein
MTERTYSIPPQIATPSQSAINTVATTFTKDALPLIEHVEDEAYIIKCICDYSDDDGNTIYCETCDTWQHIECFYHGNVEAVSRDDFSHFCADCKPRQLDRRKATERQRQQRQDRPTQDTHDKKSKRPPSKSHKKKPKPSDVQVNGHHFDHDAGHSIKAGSPIEAHPSHKKSKSSHRSHHSISSQVAKRSPSHNPRHHTHGHPLSPATTPPDLPDDFHIHSYSKQLQDLYDNDPGPQQLQTNFFASLAVTDTMSLWLRDADKLRTDSGVEEPLDVFRMVKPEVDFAAQNWTKLQVNSKEVVANDSILRLRYLIVVNPLQKKDLMVGELKGFVGFQKDYYNEETDRFARLCHPAPFVFFHPRLPLYIDTRREGSQCRYIRRSCQANAVLDTYITNQSEYHFCIINERPLASGDQVTLAWDFRFKAEVRARYLYLLGLSDDDGAGEPEVSDLEYAELRELIDNVLSDYGGCACGLGSDCAFARFHRHYLGRSHTQSNGLRHRKGRKPKQHISPTSTGQATNSRDASEGRQELYDAEDDSRSTSGSIRSKPRSRDLTPFTPLLDADPTTSDLVSEREKRKLVDIEKTFEKLDQQSQPPRKKKRISDGPSINTTAGPQKTKQKSVRSSVSNASSAPVNGSSTRLYKDAGNFQQDSDSPTTAHSPVAPTPILSRRPSHQPSMPQRSRQPSPLRRNNYVDLSTQTEPDDDWYSVPKTTTPKKIWVPLAKRLLNSRRKVWSERRARRSERIDSAVNGSEHQFAPHVSNSEAHESDLRPLGPGQGSPSIDQVDRPKSVGSIESVDTLPISVEVPMPDAPPSSSVSIGNQSQSTWPAVLISPNPSTTNDHRAPDLRVQMPPVPSFSGPPAAQLTPGGSITPSSTNGTIAQSPFGSLHILPSALNSVGQHPSPVKKKLSLKDYKARLASVSKTPTGDGESASATLKPSSLVEESKIPGILEGSSILDSPVTERGSESLTDMSGALKTMQPAMSDRAM